MKLFLIFVLLFILAFVTRAQEIPKVRIDPSKAYGGKVSEYFSEVEYIPLENTSESVFGDIWQMIITDSSIVIWDYDTNCVLFFSLQGKFFKKIKIDRALQPRIIYDIDRKRILLLSMNWLTIKGYLKEYDLKGNSLKEKPIRIESQKMIGTTYLGDGVLIGGDNCRPADKQDISDSIYYLASLIKDNKIVKSYIPYNQQLNMGFCTLLGSYSFTWGNPLIIRNKSFYLSTPLDYRVYKITKDSATEVFQFVLPVARTVPKAIMNSENHATLDSMRKDLVQNPKLVTNFSKIFFEKRLLFFRLNSMSYFSTTGSTAIESQYNFIYDTISKKLISIERITPDNSSFYLPVINQRTATFGLEFFGKNIYTSLSSLELFAAHAKNKHRNPQYPPVLQKYFKEENRKSNPVIVRMKLKE